jgi:hypothetical protein
MRLALSKGPNLVGVFSLLHMRMETDPVSETSCFYSQKYWTMGKIQNPSNFMCYTPSSEPYKIYLYNLCWMGRLIFAIKKTTWHSNSLTVNISVEVTSIRKRRKLCAVAMQTQEQFQEKFPAFTLQAVSSRCEIINVFGNTVVRPFTQTVCSEKWNNDSNSVVDIVITCNTKEGNAVCLKLWSQSESQQSRL